MRSMGPRRETGEAFRTLFTRKCVMSVLPNKSVDRIQWCEQHLAIFAANAVAIGTTAAAVTDLTTKTTAARAGFNTQKTTQDAAKDATVTYKLALAAMTDAVADIIKSFK